MPARRRLAALLVAGLLHGATPPPAAAEEGSTLQLWLHRRSPGEPFRFYGFFDAAGRYFQAHVLGQGPDPVDVTTVIRTVAASERGEALRGEIEALEGRIAGRPVAVAERDRHLARMRREKASIRARLGEARRRQEAARAAAEAGGIVESVRARERRTRDETGVTELEQRLARVEDEIARTERGRSRAADTGALADELARRREALKRLKREGPVVEAPVELYLVSPKPLMLLVLGGILLLAAVSVRLGRRTRNLAVGASFGAAMAGLACVFLAVVRAERWIPPVGIVAGPVAFGTGLLALVTARGLAERLRRNVGASWALWLALVPVALVQLAAPVRDRCFDAPVLVDAVRPILFFAAWGFAAVTVLERRSRVPVQVLAMAVATLATVMLGEPSPWLGTEDTLGALGVGAVLGVALVASDEARGRLAPVPKPRPEEPLALEEPEIW